jgi:hypothetical protein
MYYHDVGYDHNRIFVHYCPHLHNIETFIIAATSPSLPLLLFPIIGDDDLITIHASTTTILE